MALNDEAEALRKIPMFANLPAAKLKLLAFTSDALTFMDGEELAQIGDRSEYAYVIVDGEVEILTNDWRARRLRVREEPVDRRSGSAE